MLLLHRLLLLLQDVHKFMSQGCQLDGRDAVTPASFGSRLDKLR